MARVNKQPTDRKKEIEEVKKKESISVKTKFGQEIKPKFMGGKENNVI